MTTACLHFQCSFDVNNGIISGRCATCGAELTHEDVIAATGRIAKVDQALGQLQSRGHQDGVTIINQARALHDLNMHRARLVDELEALDAQIEAQQRELQPLLERHDVPTAIGRELAAGKFDALVDVISSHSSKSLPQAK